MDAERAKSTQMGLLACISYVVGNVIGSGIFITPSTVLQQAGSIGMFLYIWFFCGVISILGGISYIELGTAIPSDGGDFAYATFVGWKAVAFSFMIVSAILTYPASTAVQAVIFGDYLTTGILQFVAAEQGTVTFLKYFLAICLLVACTIINMYSQNKYGGYFQIVVTIAKGIILAIVIIIGGIYAVSGEAADNLANPMNGSHYGPGDIVMAGYGGLWSYAGWDILNYGAPSVKNPRVALPVSLIGGLSMVTLTYVLTNFAFAAVLGPTAMMASTAVAADFAKESMGPFAVLIPFAAAILLLGTLNANIFCSSRILLEAAREGHLFEFLSAVHKPSGSPRAAVVFQFFIALIFMAVNVETIINYVSFIIYAQKLVTMAALFYIRYTGMEVDSGVMRVPIVISILFALVCLVLVAIPFYSEPVMTVISAIAVASSMLIYQLFVRRRIRPRSYAAMSGAINIMLMRYLDAEVSQVEEPVQVMENVQESSRDLLNDD